LKKRYDFSNEERKQALTNGVRAVISEMLTRACYVTFPPGVVKVFVIFLWISVLSVTFEWDSLEYISNIFSIVNSVTLVVFRSKLYVLYMLYFLVITHVLESLYVLFILFPIISTPSALLSWMGMVFLLGQPCTARALLVYTANSKKIN